MKRRQYLTAGVAMGVAGVTAGCLDLPPFEEGPAARPDDRSTPGGGPSGEDPDTGGQSPDSEGYVTWGRAIQLRPDEANSNDYFGQSVSFENGLALVGAPFESALGGQAGAAYVFREGDGVWTQRRKLTASDGEEGDFFGAAVAVDFSTIVVGAPGEDEPWSTVENPRERAIDRGAVYEFRGLADTWTEEAKLTASGSQVGDRFGSVLALEGDLLVVGAPGRDLQPSNWDSPATDAGVAYIFRRSGDTWNELGGLSPTDVRAGAQFGQAVDIDGGAFIVGRAGDAYVYTPSGDRWRAETSFSVGEPWEEFGVSVALSGDTAIVGQLRGVNENGVETGAAYVFVRTDSGWRQQAKLTPRDGEDGASFGSAVALEGDVALVGADGRNYLENYPGAAYVFTRTGDTWTERARLEGHAEFNPSNDRNRFGRSVSLDGATGLVGAESGATNGAAYVFPAE
jgi:hypothetical protein